MPKKTDKPVNKAADKQASQGLADPENKSFLKPAEKKEAAQSSAGIKKGDKIKVDYTGSFDDGTVFDDSSKHGQPLEFEVGAGMIIPGFEKAIIGMKKGEEKNIHLEPCDAYGDVNPEATKKIPKEHLPKEQEPQVGMVLLINLPNGMQLPARITEVSEKEVTIDLNHPLAGKCLNFKIKVVEIN
jgi:FKBP-type peptidyl-prolyl cis-trans isomerase 2